MPPKTDRRFFDPSEPGKRRKNAAEMCARFNELHPEGTPIRVYPLARWLEDCKKETVVKIPGDCIALTHVQIINPSK